MVWTIIPKNNIFKIEINKNNTLLYFTYIATSNLDYRNLHLTKCSFTEIFEHQIFSDFQLQKIISIIINVYL